MNEIKKIVLGDPITLEDFVAQLHSRPTRPAIWNGSGYDVVDEF